MWQSSRDVGLPEETYLAGSWILWSVTAQDAWPSIAFPVQHRVHGLFRMKPLPRECGLQAGGGLVWAWRLAKVWGGGPGQAAA